MEFSPHHRLRDVAMPADGRTPGDERRDRGRDGRGMTSRPSPSPAAVAHRSREPDRDSRKGRPRDRSPENPQPGRRHRHRSRDRSRERPHRSFPPSPRGHRDPRDFREDRRDRNRDRESRPTGDHRSPPPPPGERSHARDKPPRPEGESRLPSSAKRPRSPSAPVGDSQPKRSRRDDSPRRPERGPPKDPQNANSHRRHSPSPRRLSRSPPPSRRERRPKSKKKPKSSRPLDPRRGRSRSPLPDQSPYLQSDNPNLQPLGESRGRGRSPSPAGPQPPRHRSYSRRRSPRPSRGERPPTSSETASRRRPSPRFDSRKHREPRYPPRSPRDKKDLKPKPGKRGTRRDDSRASDRSEVASGANSVEVNMSARGGFRGGYNAQMQGPYQGASDSRRFSHSSGHRTPHSSFHGSPPPQSPYGGSQGGWQGQPQQYSPQGQFTPQYPNGPQGQFHQGHSPSYGPPTGPNSQYAGYPTGPSRGGFRGGPGGFRGNHFNSNRGAYRGNNSKNGQWRSNSQGNSGHTSPMSASNHADQSAAPDEDVPTGDGENPFRPSKDLQVEDTSNDPPAEEEPMAPPNRQPPTGPQASKFSFAFKAASKPSATAPKAEITSKFNAAPQRREAIQNEDKDRRELPRSVPTEPASSRARAEQRNRPEPPRAPASAPVAPRVRKVKKIMKRPKPRPTLTDDLASSTSVYYRKPGDGSVVGSGTYGKVFKGRHVYTKTLVALKKIRMEGERDGFPVTAVREIKLLQSLKHRNIVDLQEVMVEKNDCFMVFEYLSHDLTGLLNHPTFTLDAAQKKDLTKQLFESLDYLHKRGVLHRDIKAANILVSSQGILKLADFGLARFYAKHHQLDYTNRVITIWYRSPELLLGETQYGPAVDVWSAACVMVEIFTRHAIFPGDGGEISQLDKIYAVIGTPSKAEWPGLVDMPWFELLRPGHRKPNVFAEKYRDRLSPAAFELLAAMFQYDPVKRPTASQVLEHPYFTEEEPAPRQAIELADLDGDWHEYESKALRRENERREREARKAQAKEAAGAGREKDKKRPAESTEPHRDSKRQHVDERQLPRVSQAEGGSKRPETVAGAVPSDKPGG